LKDANIVCPVLERMMNGELSLSEMGLEFKRIKVLMIVQRAFLITLEEETWDACKTKYLLHCTDEVLNNFVPTFQTWVSQHNFNILD
jgi:hypothetical protein